jgi:hypothetical protein
MKIRYVAMSLILAASPLAAHDLWIQPSRFQVQPGAAVPATFQVGHADHRQRWGVGPSRIVRLDAVSAAGRRDIRADMTSGGAADLVTRLATPGVHILAMQSTQARSELPAGQFTEYAREEGLAPILAHRARTGASGAPGRERYSRRAKTLIQVGLPTAANQAIATRAIGLTLEIVPERSPYALGANRILPVRVMYKGRPLPGATVKLTNLKADAKPLAVAVTGTSGRASFRVPARGEWLLNVVWGEPVSGVADADYETIFSSLTFGERADRRR